MTGSGCRCLSALLESFYSRRSTPIIRFLAKVKAKFTTTDSEFRSCPACTIAFTIYGWPVLQALIHLWTD
jgi:hypothetical protein